MFLAHKDEIEKNNYKPLEQFNKRKVLVCSDELQLVSNICPHQKSIISLVSGQGNRVCPYHNWSFDLKGNPLTSGRTSHYCKNEKNLETHSVFDWNHLLFTEKINFDIDVSFRDLILMEERIDFVEADFKTIIDIFLDVDHIQSVHSGVYDLVGITNTDVLWKYYDYGSVQTVEQGALWITVYPYTMIEWQLGSLFVTVAQPHGINQTKVCVFKYADKNYLEQWKLNEKVWEIAWKQDRSQAEIISEFSTENLEPQKIHFRNFLKENGIY
jgi:phenylpropionate dioxygenase-like ring-hydroxylating dioxygenase large terminal subunit